MWFFLKGSGRFRKEIEDWERSGIISPEQTSQLIDMYELDQEPPWYRRSSFILRSVAILLAAMGLMLLIGANWEDFNTPVRMVMGLLPLLLAYGLSLYFYQKGDKDTAEIAMSFASLAFGGNIVLQAQIFHISGYFPDGILWWIIGALPVIYLFRNSLLAMVFQGLFMMWLSFQNEFEHFSLWSVPLMAVFGYLLYRQPNNFTLLFTLASFFAFISNIIISATGSWYLFSDGHIILFVATYPLLFLVLFHFLRHQYSEEFGENLQNLLLFVVIFLLYLCTFDGFLEGLVRAIVRNGITPAIYAMFAIATALLLATRQFKNVNLSISFGIVALFFLPALLLPRIPPSNYDYASTDSFSTSYAVLMNVVMLALCIWKIYDGIQQKHKRRFISGIFYLVVLAISRYMTLFNDYITTSLIFIACGIGIYFINNLWDKKYAAK